MSKNEEEAQEAYLDANDNWQNHRGNCPQCWIGDYQEDYCETGRILLYKRSKAKKELPEGEQW
jgi:hypothetical protein